ncbi:Uncharacterised protein [Chlamydia trachomatis]|nr:Uncharacterised protein [Chlamydia trachomatis]
MVASAFLALSVTVTVPVLLGVPLRITLVLSSDTFALRFTLPSPANVASNVVSSGMLALVKGSSTLSSFPTCAPVTSPVSVRAGSGAAATLNVFVCSRAVAPSLVALTLTVTSPALVGVPLSFTFLLAVSTVAVSPSFASPSRVAITV